MKLVFLSNYFNHHQQPLSEALSRQPGISYHFIATMPLPPQREKLGYHMEKLPEYVCPAWRSREDQSHGMELLAAADVVIAGSAPEELVRLCIRQNKLLLRYSERPLKKGLELWRYPDRFLRWHWKNPSRKPIYMLCASGFAARDYRKFGLFRGKTFQWGYFPETRRYPAIDTLILKKDLSEILWCGRFLEWKHPDDAIAVARKLRDGGCQFHMHFIGSGPMEAIMKRLIREYRLGDCVTLLGAMPPDQVRTHMEKAGIYLFTSDRQEGWGAVLNESMNSGCAVVAGNAIGSVPYLLEDGNNGLIYASGNVEMLCEKVQYLLENPEVQGRLGRAAYETIVSVWNAETAAERLIQLIKSLLTGDKTMEPFTSGPCSRAD